MPVIDMSKNQKISMTKEDGTAVKNIFIKNFGLDIDEGRD